MSTAAIRRMPRVRVAVVDVGANTLRLLVAEAGAGGLSPVHEERRRTALGEDVERLGRLTDEKIERSAEAARKEVRRARKLGAARVQIVVTSPWRNAENGSQLVEALEQASGLGVRALTTEEEAELAYLGALASTDLESRPIAVCDVGGGSTQLAIGSGAEPAWLRSVPLGSLRLTERCLGSDPPTSRELSDARGEADVAFASLTPPLPGAALATGGTARALRRAGFSVLDTAALERAIEVLAEQPVAVRARKAKAEPHRARTLPAGAIILARVQALLQVRLQVAVGGIREGVCVSLLEAERATA
jgi:exopolyphosphatase / guanosine-5'-triphosphate,3'-diphosphate pyrophosphatase